MTSMEEKEKIIQNFLRVAKGDNAVITIGDLDALKSIISRMTTAEFTKREILRYFGDQRFSL